MSVSFIAASTLSRNSLSGIGSSPWLSRWALMTVRRYFVTVTPGIATGYWKAMNRPIRARSSGSASCNVLTLEQNPAVGHLEAGVTHDRVGERRLAGPVRTHQRVDLALADLEIEAAEDLLLADADMEIADLEQRRHQAITTGRPTGASAPGSGMSGVESARRENSTRSASVVV